MLCLLAALSSCGPDKTRLSSKPVYFDLKGFFRSDSARLAAKNPLITKTVQHNGITETKKLHINNWGNELRLFAQSDINKPAWRASYTVTNTDNLTLYKAKFPDLTTREIVVKRESGKVKWIMIYNYTKNMLYESKEQLSYFPDSIYTIVKKQHVKIIGNNSFLVKGTLNN